MIRTIRTVVDVHVEVAPDDPVTIFEHARSILSHAGVSLAGSMDLLPAAERVDTPATGTGVQLRLDLEPRGPWVKPTWPGNW